MSEQFDLVIIGAGPGGYSTALRAAELGMKVALVERDATVGGTCLNRGCIPSKALITATHIIDTVHRAAELGVNASVNGIDFGTLRDYRLRVVKTMVGGLAGLLAHRGITVFRANAAFHADETAPATSNHIVHLVPSPDQSDILTYHKADVPEPSGPTMDLTATNIVIATGAKPRPLPGNPFAGALIDSTQALEVNEFPSSAVIIGAGAIALEFASMWNAAGSKVTLLIRKDRVLSAWDRRAGTTLTRELKRHGVNIITRASVTHVDTGANLGATVHYTCEGQDGERVNVELYMNDKGEVSTTKQTLKGVLDNSEYYNYSSADRDKLIEDGTKKLQEYWADARSVSVALDASLDLYDVGDTVGGTDAKTGIFASAKVTKKIMKMDERGSVTVQYETGAI